MFGVAHSTLLGHCWETPFQECYKILWSDHMLLVPAAAVAPVHSARFFAARWPFLWGDLLLLGLFNVTWCYLMWLDFLKSWIRAWQFIVNVQFVGHQLSLHSPGVGASWPAEEDGSKLHGLLLRVAIWALGSPKKMLQRSCSKRPEVISPCSCMFQLKRMSDCSIYRALSELHLSWFIRIARQ